MNLFLAFKRYSLFSKLYCQSFLVDLFSEPRTKNTMYFHRCTNDLVSLMLVS